MRLLQKYIFLCVIVSTCIFVDHFEIALNNYGELIMYGKRIIFIGNPFIGPYIQNMYMYMSLSIQI